MNHRTLSSEGRSLGGSCWNHSVGTDGGMAFAHACSRCVPHVRFISAKEHSLFEVMP